ncbi:hypothetical protein MBLNU13_g04651t2 [Cladosporium sp. NU13]
MLGVATQYVDEQLRVKAILLGLGPMYGAYGGFAIADEVSTVMRDFKISDHIGYFAADNASNNDSALRHIAKEIDFDPSSQTRSTSAGGSQVRKDKPQVQDDRAVSIDMGRFKGAKNYNVIRDGLRAGLKVNKVTETLTIKSLRPGPGDRIDVVFANKDETSRTKQHTPWLTSSLAGARVKGEQWYPVKSDSVVKHSVLDRDSWSKSQMH